jgi:hypothetical protein
MQGAWPSPMTSCTANGIAVLDDVPDPRCVMLGSNTNMSLALAQVHSMSGRLYPAASGPHTHLAAE